MDIKRVGLVTTVSPFELVLCWCFMLFRRCMHSSRTSSSSTNQATPLEGGVSTQLMVILIRTPHTIRATHFLRGFAQQAGGHNRGELHRPARFRRNQAHYVMTNIYVHTYYII